MLGLIVNIILLTMLCMHADRQFLEEQYIETMSKHRPRTRYSVQHAVNRYYLSTMTFSWNAF